MRAGVTVRRRKIRQNNARKRLVCFLLLAVLLMVVVFAGQLCPYDPNAQIFSPLQPPSTLHPAGTDRLGRDQLSRILIGLRTSVLSTLVLVGIITAAGTTAGILCGYLGGWVDSLIMRVSDICSMIAQLHGSRLELESRENEGTRVWVTLREAKP